mmetsp:Transcript_8258/g.21920  ORF Transcript_8258/g.21920 Transcript_8258/m.21920 type:complete len:163 (+) Transcript_8258:1012-1500(+)
MSARPEWSGGDGLASLCRRAAGQPSETPMAKRVIIVCPTSLVNNWDAEVNKWLTWDKKVHVKTLPLCESTKSLVMRAISDFIHPQAVHQVMILSYETFRIHHKRFLRCGMKKKDDPAAFLAAARQGGPCAASACDLLICDEAQRRSTSRRLSSGNSTKPSGK